MPVIYEGTTDRFIQFVAVDATDLTTRETGLTSFTAYYSLDNATDTVVTTPTTVEKDASLMPGVYSIAIDESGMTTLSAGDDSGTLVLHITKTGMAPVTIQCDIVRRAVTAGYTLGVESDGDLTKVNTLNGHTAQTGDNYARIGAGGASLGDLGGMSTAMKGEVGDAVWDELESGHTDTGKFGRLRIGVNVNKIDGDTGPADNLGRIAGDTGTGSYIYRHVDTGAIADAVWGKTNRNLTELGALDTGLSGVVADAVWDEEDTGHQVVGTMGFRQNDTGEIANAVWGYTAAEPGQETPASTNTMLNKLGYLFKGWRNKKDQTATLWQLYNDDAATVDQKATVSDNGTTATKTEVESGP